MYLMRKIHINKIIIFIGALSLVYFILMLYVLSRWNLNDLLGFEVPKERKLFNVYIIGKAAVGQYLWLHIFDGDIEYINGGFFQEGNMTVSDITFIYLSGPGYIQNTIPQNIEYMVLVLNGRTFKNTVKAKEWLDYLHYLPSLRNVAVLLLGNERCQNDWIIKYLKSNGGVIDALFIVYDSPLVDDKEVFQWPLGVATYRGFPPIKEQNILHVNSARKFTCNFMGTVYKNSSREILNVALKNNQSKHTCYILTRNKWLPEETDNSLHRYIKILQESDLTLSPVGINSECYRIYEAMSLGSVPVVEDIMTPGKCVSPFRLLKKYNAPIIYVRNWTNISEILFNEKVMNISSIIQRRTSMLVWYHGFKKSLSKYFVDILKNKFCFQII